MERHDTNHCPYLVWVADELLEVVVLVDLVVVVPVPPVVVLPVLEKVEPIGPNLMFE